MGGRRKAGDHPIHDSPPPAAAVISEIIGCDQKVANKALLALVKAGYVIAPREPTNAMFEAYLSSYGACASTPNSIVIAIGKARKRWKAMALSGTRMVLSLKHLK
jgi:hypothetical protein